MELTVISHTHWDREWYQTFQQYRVRLVSMIDDLLETMEQNIDYHFFHFDGQTIIIKDYLEIRPQNRDRLFRLIQQGRIIIGPWYVMPDEFLVSGESLIHNLVAGHDICVELGISAMKNGYVTDIFGHNSQLPQILSGFDIDNAVLFRGIADYEKDAFLWEGKDKTQILVLKLDKNRSYSNFYFASRWPFEGRELDRDELVSRMKAFFEYLEPQCCTNQMLLFDGVDHAESDSRVLEIMQIIREEFPEMQISQGRLEDYTSEFRNKAVNLEVIKGPLYSVGKSGNHNQLLKNVLSSMVFLKQENDECERLLERWAEPMGFFAGMVKNRLIPNVKDRTMDPQADYSRYAWRLLMENHPHDSICGCSVNEVHQDNEHRFRQVNQVAQELILANKRKIANSIDSSNMRGKDGALTIFHTGQQDYIGIVVFELEVRPYTEKNLRLYDSENNELPFQILEIYDKNEKIIEFKELVRLSTNIVFKIAAPLQIPAMGYTVISYDNLMNQWASGKDYKHSMVHLPKRYDGSMRISPDTFNTGLLEVRFLTDGTLSVTDKETGKCYDRIHGLEDSGDYGDGWNYRQPTMDSQIFGGGIVQISVENDGPFTAVVQIRKTFMIPCGLQKGNQSRTEHRESLEIITNVLLKKDSKNIEFSTRILNIANQHRLRMAFCPSMPQVNTFYTKTPFDMQCWEVRKPDCSDYIEKDTNVNPMQGILHMNDGDTSFSVYTKGLYEVEVKDDTERTVMVTLYRTVSDEAGFENNGSNIMRRELNFQYAVDFTKYKTAGDALIAGENWRCGFDWYVSPKHRGTLPQSCSFMQIRSDEAVVFSTANEKQLRVYAPGKGTSATLTFTEEVDRAWKEDFLHSKKEELAVCGRQIFIELREGEIATVKLEWKV